MTTLRLRLVFAALALALALPGALLVQRALEGVAAERAARERAVAERIFDQMERALSELLGAEEARPASDYDFASPSSPLRARPAGSLALGWFQIEADGSVAAPDWSPRAAALAAEIALDGARLEAARVASAAGESSETRRRAAASAEPGRAASAPASAAPKSELARAPLQPASPPAAETVARERDAAQAAEPPPPSPRGETDAFAALSKLNTGAKEREERRQRVYLEQQAAPGPREATEAAGDSADSAAPASSPAADPGEARQRSQALVAGALAAELGEPAPGAAEAAPAPESGAAPPAPEPDLPRAAPAEAVAEAAPPAAHAAAAPIATAAPLAASAGELVRVVVDPMRGRLARGGELLLLRSAWIGVRGVRQGVAFELSALERSLAAGVLAQAELGDARLRVAARAALGADAASPERRSFAHRFGEPFEALGAELSFAPFPDEGAHSVYWLAALFSLAGAAGLYAAYRSTAIALHFAERRSNFAAAVSHELKTPLTAIRLYAEMLRDGVVSSEEKRREYSGSITAESERLSRLIDGVLEFSRLERGARDLALGVGDPAPVVREAVELLRPHAAAHGLALELCVEDALPAARFERDALRQIVFNLLDNAVKYGRGEPARIEVACRRAGTGVAIVVRDHGPGVPREELARILEPFYRRGDELTRSAPGAGIGLALVRSLAQEMGAALALENAEGGGLAVCVTLAGSAPA